MGWNKGLAMGLEFHGTVVPGMELGPGMICLGRRGTWNMRGIRVPMSPNRLKSDLEIGEKISNRV